MSIDKDGYIVKVLSNVKGYTFLGPTLKSVDESPKV